MASVSSAAIENVRAENDLFIGGPMGGPNTATKYAWMAFTGSSAEEMPDADPYAPVRMRCLRKLPCLL
jgi:hypothetical protein